VVPRHTYWTKEFRGTPNFLKKKHGFAGDLARVGGLRQNVKKQPQIRLNINLFSICIEG